MLLECSLASAPADAVPPTRSRWIAAALLAWTAIALTCSIRAYLSPRTNDVYATFASAARRWEAGASAYATTGEAYRYGPAITALLVPFSWCSDRIGAVAWRLVNAGLLLVGLCWWTRVALPRRLSERQRALFLLAIVPLSVGSLNNGQSNALLLGLLLVALAASVRDCWNLAAGCLALACLLKVYPVALALLLGALFPRQLPGRFVAALALWVGISFLLHRPSFVASQYAEWYALLCADARHDMRLDVDYRNFRSLVRAWVGPMSPTAFTAVQLFAGLGSLALCLTAHRAGWDRRRLLLLAWHLSACWMTVFGSATESCTYILLAPSLAWMLFEACRTERGMLIRGFVLAAAALFGWCLVVVWFPGARAWHAHGGHSAAGLLLLAAVLAAVWQDRSCSQEVRPWLSHNA
jgi:hypothetical protein